MIPARWNAVQISVAQLHHARVGVTAKTLANHKSNVRAALRWFGKEHDVPQRGMRAVGELGEASATGSITAYGTGSTVSCATARPAASARRRSTTRLFDEYWRYRTETTALASNNTARRFMARTWNACAGEIDGWPLQRLTEPPIKLWPRPAWEDFPDGLRSDLDDYFGGLTKPRRSLTASAFSHAARHDPNPPGRTRCDGPHGCPARRADREA